jgi:hypothetical protein
MGFFKKLHDKVTAPDCSIELKLNNWTVSLGENLQGSLEVHSRENFDSTEVRCVIECTETAKIIKYEYDPSLKRSLPRVATESSIVFVATPVLSGLTKFNNSENRAFPINVSLPLGGKLSYQGIDNRIVWTIKGIVAVDGRPDVTTSSNEFQVLQLPQSTTGQQVVKEVVHEVVKIPCRYCQTLFNQLDTACPNCGAKRTV